MIHVNDASRAVGVVSNLLQKDKREAYTLKIREEYEAFKTKFLERTTAKSYLTIEQARANPFLINWDSFKVTVPKHLGKHTLEKQDLEVLVDYIDWTPFSALGICMESIPYFKGRNCW